MDTVSEVIEKLLKKGYKGDFVMTKKGLTVRNSGENLLPDQIKIRKIYRFEGDSNPDDMSVLYAIESYNGIKGILINAYGTYAGNESEDLSEFLKQVMIEEKTLL